MRACVCAYLRICVYVGAMRRLACLSTPFRLTVPPVPSAHSRTWLLRVSFPNRFYAQVLAVKQDLAKIMLTAPVCTCEGEKIALSRRVDKHWRLIGWGEIRRGSKIDCDESN